MKIKQFLYLCAIQFIVLATSLGANAQVYNYYFGNIHAHTEYSDGNAANLSAYKRAKPCFEYAKVSQNSNFYGISEHNHSMAGMLLPNFHKGLLEADSVNQNSVFTTLYGMEYGVISGGGHVLVYGIDSLIGWETGNYDIYNSQYDYSSLFQKINRHPGAFAYLAHMQSTDYGNLLTQPYNALWDSAIVGLAIRSGPAFSSDTTYNNPSTSTYNARYQDLLKKGYHVSVGMDGDNHNITFDRATDARTVILATSLSRANVMDAYRKLRFYASDDWNAKVDFKVNGKVMGSVFSSNADASITLTITDADAETTSSIKIWYGVPASGSTATALTSNTNSSSISFTHSMVAGSSYYYYAEITQADGDKIWTAPIWFNKNSSVLPIELVSFTAEKRKQQIILNWTTASEINNNYFSVLRSSDNLIFEPIAKINGGGNSSSLLNYSAIDQHPLTGINYYRLDQYDFNGEVSSSSIVMNVCTEKNHSIQILNNPSFNSLINYVMINEISERATVQLLDELSNVIYTEQIFVEKGEKSYSITTAHLSNGIYFLKFYFQETNSIETLKVEVRE